MVTRIHRMTLAVLVVVCVSVLGATPAGAKTGYANLCPTLKTVLCAEVEGAFAPSSVAVDNSGGSSAGDVWVMYGGSEVDKRLVKFDASGNQLVEAEIGSLPGSAKRIVYGGDVAVDSTSGDVYFASKGFPAGSGGAVTKFNSAGVFQLQVTETPQGPIEPAGLAVDAGGNLYVEDENHGTIDKFTSSGVYVAQFSAPAPSGSVLSSLAVGQEGNLYAGFAGQGQKPNSANAESHVVVYSPAGAPVNCPGTGNIISFESKDNRQPVAVDPSDGHLFVTEATFLGEPFIAEYSSLNLFCALTPSARLGEGEFGKIGDGPAGVGVGGATHGVYVSGVVTNSVLIYGLVTLPAVTTSAASSVTPTSAVVSGTVNPEGTEVTTCEFEYGPSLAYGQTRPCAQPLPLTGTSQVAVSAEISFALPPGGAIHYRLKAASSAGVELGADQTITRPITPLVVGGLPASGVTQFTATLNGTLQTGEAPANYHFQYGPTTAYGSIAPVPDSYTPLTLETLTVSQPVSGLQAGTTYHCRLVASGPGGTEVAGPDETFTTLPIPAPTVQTGGASGVGVGSATLSGSIDPHGWDTTYLFEYGTSASYGQSWPTVQVDMGALEGPQPVVVNVPNLLPGTTYHYRLVATNGGGTSYGPDMTFTTGEYPAQVIQEPVAIRTLLVPSGKGAGPSSKHGKQGRRHTKRKRRARHKKKR